MHTKFTDDVKLGGVVESLEAGEALQRNLDKLKGWATTNHVKFNKSKCQTVHLRQDNPEYIYRLEDLWWENSPRKVIWE